MSNIDAAKIAGLVERLRQVYDSLSPGSIERADLDGMAFTVAGTITALESLTDTRGEEKCELCGGANYSWFAPSPLWNAIMRGGSIDGPWKGGEIVCPTCFMGFGEAAGIASDWKVTARTVNVELETVTPSGRVWDDELDLWIDPNDARSLPTTGDAK